MAVRQIETKAEIDAPPERVWAVLTDFAAMPQWNPFITAITGSPVEGSRLSVSIAPPGKRPMRFRPTVIAVRPERELRWLGRLLLPGLFDGEHYFLLESRGDGRTRLTHGERFSGLLVGPFGKTLDATRDGFEAMNAALKAQAERPAHAAAG